MGHVNATTLVVVGLTREARLLAGSGCPVIVGGGDKQRLLAALAVAAAPPVARVLSFGMAGGLQPGLPPGAMILAERVFDDVASHDVDAGWRGELRRLLPRAQRGDLAGVDAPVAAVEAKLDLQRRTGAAAVDMESHVVALFARERGLKFAALRAIADPAERVLPPAALVAMRADGGIDISAVARSVWMKPEQIGALVGLAMDASASMRSLEIAARALTRGR